MTPAEYVQLKAFARQDGALLSLLWIGSFICYIQGMTIPVLSMVAVLLVVASPFYAASRLRHFRDVAREGVITFARGYAYTVLIYFYAGLLVAAALFFYFALLDRGYLFGKFTEMFNSPEGQQALQQYGMAEQMSKGLEAMADMRPVDYALNVLTLCITGGFMLGLPTAMLFRRKAIQKVDNQR